MVLQKGEAFLEHSFSGDAQKRDVELQRYSDDRLRHAISGSNLGKTSKKTYIERLNALQNMTGKTLLELLSKPKITYSFLVSRYDQVQSRKAYINAILTLYKHLPSLKEDFADAHATWREYFDVVHRASEERYDNNTPSVKQQMAFMPWDKIIEARDKLPDDSVEYLFLCCHTMIPPIRADLDHVKFYINETPSSLENPNYILITRGKSGPWKMTLVLTEFKTSKALKSYQKVLPAELCAVIKKSLLRFPRDYLFVSSITGKPFNSPATYTRFANRILHRVLKPYKVTISMLRHIFVSSLDHSRLTSGQKSQIAKDMMHSPIMFDKYRLFFDESASDLDSYVLDIDDAKSATGSSKRCLCRCVDV